MRRIEVTDFGARGDNNSDATAGFEAAIAAAARHSTGHTLIRVPPGTYRVYPLSLASRMTLHLAAGATLLGMPFDVAARPWTQQPALPNWSRSRGGAILLRNGSGERVLVQRNESKALLHGADLDDVGVSGEGPSSMIEMHGWDWWGKRETGVERGWNGTRPHLMRFVRSEACASYSAIWFFLCCGGGGSLFAHSARKFSSVAALTTQSSSTGDRAPDQRMDEFGWTDELELAGARVNTSTTRGGYHANPEW